MEDSEWTGRSWKEAPGDGTFRSESSTYNGRTSDKVPEPWYVDTQDLVLEPSEPRDHRFTIIGLHSCSGGPDDLLPFFHRLNVPVRRHIRREDHSGWMKEQNSWFEYDDDSKDGNELKYPEQLLEQRSRLLRLLESERLRFPDCDGSRLMLWGLSQGVGIAIDVALRAPFAVGAVLALRGMALPQAQLMDLPLQAERNHTVQLLAINGTYDWLCPPDAAQASYEALRPYGACVEFVEEPTLGHACARGRQKLNAAELRRVNQLFLDLWGKTL